MKYSIIIPTYNQCSELKACLNSLCYQKLEEGISFEVIVIDDGSSDETINMLEQINVPYNLKYKQNLRSNLSSRAQVRNIGVDLSDGDVLIFLDGDHIVQPSFIQSHNRYHQIEKDIVLCGLRSFVDSTVLKYGNLAPDKLEEMVIDRDARIDIIKKFSGNLGGMTTSWHLCFSCNLSVRREHFVKLGGFDPNFIGWGLEDCELGYRLKKFGLKIAIDLSNESMIYHIGAPKRVYSEEIFNEWTKNYNYFREKYCDDLSVALQKIVGDYLNPRKQTDISYLTCYTNFEYASRLLENKSLPSISINKIFIIHINTYMGFNMIDFDQGADKLLIVVDHSKNVSMNLELQNTKNSPYQILYYDIDFFNKFKVEEYIRSQYPGAMIIQKSYQ